jgi:hypothetical protein
MPREREKKKARLTPRLGREVPLLSSLPGKGKNLSKANIH